MKSNFILAAFILAMASCKSIKDKSLSQICYDRGFYQVVEKVSLRDTQKIKQLEGKFIEVEGLFRYVFEDVALYPSKTAEPPEAMWVNIIVPDAASDKQLDELNERNVVIIGKVNLKRKGHFNGYMGSLDSAFCIKAK
jgi:hypothetical protein